MNYRRLGRTGIKVSEVGLGTWTLCGVDLRASSDGRQYHAGWGAVSQKQALEVVNTALRVGINVFDTADTYGWGRSERVLGQALQGYPRDQVILITKVGYVPPTLWDSTVEVTADGLCCTPQYLAYALHNSLERLQTDYIDIYLLHLTDPDLVRKHNPWSALREFLQCNKVRAYGVSVRPDQASWVRELIEVHGCTVFEVPYSISQVHAARQLFPLARMYDVGIIARSVLSAGALTGKYEPGHIFAEDDWRNHCFGNRSGFDAAARLAKQLASLDRPGQTLAQAAIRFVLSSEVVGTAIVGARTPQQVIENANASSQSLSQQDMECIIMALRDKEIAEGDR